MQGAKRRIVGHSTVTGKGWPQDQDYVSPGHGRIVYAQSQQCGFERWPGEVLFPLLPLIGSRKQEVKSQEVTGFREETDSRREGS